MSLTIHTKDLGHFLDEIIEKYPTYGPTENKMASNSRFRFAKLSKSKEFVLQYGSTVIPPKKYLFPAKEDIFRFEGGEILPPSNKEFVVFGVNKKDGEGLFYLDQVFSGPIIDERYLEKRKHMHLVVIDSLPPSNSLNCDLYLQIVGPDHLEAFPFTEFGERLIAGNKYFGHVGDIGALSVRHMPDEVVFHPRLDEIIEKSREHPVWDRLAAQCFNCGICSYVCPLCYCYEQEDQLEITENVAADLIGARVRRWDSCMLSDFAAVTFRNFRPETKDRIYNWYYHKFVRMPREYGFSGCVDCGRCIEFCPAKINYREVLKELIADEKRK